MQYYVHIHVDSSHPMLPMSANEAERNAAFSLLLPGKVLHLNALSHLRKFRDHNIMVTNLVL